MKFVIFVIDGPSNIALSNEMEQIDTFNEKLRKGGNWITAAGIREPGEAFHIDKRGNKKEISKGSLFNAPEHYSGFWLIEADSIDRARELAFEGSLACNRRVELRPYIQ